MGFDEAKMHFNVKRRRYAQLLGYVTHVYTRPVPNGYGPKIAGLVLQELIYRAKTLTETGIFIDFIIKWDQLSFTKQKMSWMGC